jgi:hypothetical protein
MLNRTMGCLHHTEHWPAIRVTDVVSPTTSTFGTATYAEPAPDRGHCVDRIMGDFRSERLSKCALIGLDHANFLFARRRQL